jgi:predicted nucleic acid-binding protein
MARSLLDTDILSEVIRGKNRNVTESAGVYIRTHGQLTISILTGIALSNDLELVTGNSSHYERLKPLGFNLRLANWCEG